VSESFFLREVWKSREDWLASRNKKRDPDSIRISGTEAAVCCGDSPWMDKSQLYDIKMGLSSREDISNKPYVKYGIDMEPCIREATLIDLPYFALSYKPYDILISKRFRWMTCTLDGELVISTDSNPWDLPLGSKGLLECKTGSWTREDDLEKWEDGIPVYYYEQMIHCLLVTGWDYVICAARLKRDAFKDEDLGFPEIRNFYRIIDKRSESVKEDMKAVVEYERAFIEEYIKKGRRPPKVLALED